MNYIDRQTDIFHLLPFILLVVINTRLQGFFLDIFGSGFRLGWCMPVFMVADSTQHISLDHTVVR